MSLTLRESKGSPLTHQELDNNFRYITGSDDPVIGIALMGPDGNGSGNWARIDRNGNFLDNPDLL